VFGLSAQSSFDDFKQMKVATDADAKRADAKLHSANSQGTLATILIPSGAAVLALGATLLVLDLNARESEPQIGLAPLPGGGFVSWHGRVGGL
jgi:hypothetical protein